MKKNVIMMSAAMALCAAMALSGCSKDTTVSDNTDNTENTDNTDNTAVSYTHLDVYKRQAFNWKKKPVML